MVGLPEVKETAERFESKINDKKRKEKERKPTKSNGVYLKAMPLRRLADVETIKREIEAGNILILKVSPLAKKSVADVKQAVSDLYEFAKSIDADIARLGEERVVITPPPIRIWRQKKSSEEEDLPTAA